MRAVEPGKRLRTKRSDKVSQGICRNRRIDRGMRRIRDADARSNVGKSDVSVPNGPRAEFGERATESEANEADEAGIELGGVGDAVKVVKKGGGGCP